MNILFIVHRIPYPPNKGDKIRSFNELKYLSRKHEIHLVCLADDPEDLKYVDHLKRYCKTVNVVHINPKLAKLKSIIYLFSRKPLSVPYFYSKKLQKTIDYLLSSIIFDCIFCFSSPMAEYIFRSNFQQPATRIMDFVDIDSDKWKQYISYSSFPLSWIYKLEGKRLEKYERKISERFQFCAVVSQKEAEIFRRFAHNGNIMVIPNGVDSQFFHPAMFKEQRARSKEHRAIIFTGAMDYFPNIDGVLYFQKEILPLIEKEVPDVKFYIVGSNPTQKIRMMREEENIEVTGYVDDIRPYISKASVSVVPLRIGKGIQNKILEAMAMGVPVVATSQAIAGIEVENGKEIFIEDQPQRFANRVVKLIKDEDLRKSISIQARQLVEKKYNWEVNLTRLEKVLEESRQGLI